MADMENPAPTPPRQRRRPLAGALRRGPGRGSGARRRLHHALASRSSRSTGRPTAPRCLERIGWPGEYPFTRGLYPTGYRGRTWTIRQFAGFGNAVQTNERYKMILERGGGGLSVAFDMPTLMGRDSDDPMSLGEVGHCGVAIDSAADMEMLFADIPLGDVTTSMTISGPAVPVFCMYLVAAERQGVDLGVLNGTLQTDIFKEYIAQKEWLFAPEPHLRLIGDLMEYCAENIPDYKPLSVSGYHIREAGSTAAQELAFTLADGFGYVELGPVARPGHRDLRPRAVVLLRQPPRLLRGDRQVPGGPPDLGALAARRLRREDRQGAVAAVPHPDRRGVRSPRSSPTTTSSAPPSRRSPRCSAAPTRCTPTPSTRPWPCRASRPPRSRCAPSR